MPEGQVTYTAGVFDQQFIIADQQGNARTTFDNSGTGGTAKVLQENSYYPFGMVMAGSPVALPANPNKNLYNGGSEWQNDYTNQPDVYQTFNRNYDAAIGRFVGVDPEPEGASNMTNYQYAGNCPVMMNDPGGDKATSSYELRNPTVYNPYNDTEWGFAVDLFDIDNELNNAADDAGGTIAGVAGAMDLFNSFDKLTLTASIAALWQSPYGGEITPTSIHFYNNVNQEIVGGLIQATAQNLLGSFPGAATSVLNAVGNYVAYKTLENFITGKNMSVFPTQSGPGSTPENTVDWGAGNIEFNNMGFTINGNDNVSSLDVLNVSERLEDEVDKGLTLATTPGLWNKAYRLASESSPALEFLGRATGFVTLLNNGRKTIQAWQNGDRSGAIENGLLTIGQGAAMSVGEEFELGWNAGTFLWEFLQKGK